MKTYFNLNRKVFALISGMLLCSNVHAQDPCATITPINNCGVSTNVVIPPGTGAYYFYATDFGYAYGINGKEKIYSFTPPVTGKYTLTVTNTGFISAHYLYKAALTGCSMYSWNSIGNTYYPGTIMLIGNLLAGTQYYILVDAYSDASGANHDFTINCAEGYVPCPSITPVSCGTATTFTIPAGPGAIDIPSCASYNNYPDIGKEVIYSYTPTASGRIAINVTVTTGWEWVTYYIKQAADGCNANNWTCLGGVSSIWTPYFTNAFDVIAGTTYYIMADVGTMNGASQTFNITCPETHNPCVTIDPILCAIPVTAVIPPGFGAFDTVGQFCAQYYSYYYHPGKEVIYSFTATITGVHRIEVISTNYNQANFMYKEAALGCDADSWKCIGYTAYPGSLYTSTALTAGTTYYFMVDASTGTGATSTFAIYCDPPYDPCPSISSISCGSPVNFSIPVGRGGLMTFVNSWLVTAEGKEVIYEFTPTQSGTHLLTFSAAAGGSKFLFVKEAASGCNESGWTFLGTPPYSLPGSIPISIPLIAGTSYYIMVDTYYNNFPPGASGTFQLTCPESTYNPCATIAPIPSCMTTMTTSHNAGLGAMSPFPAPGSFLPPAMGKENLFSFTPTVTGKYNFMANAGTGPGTITYSIKAASGGCNGNGWLLIGEYSNTGFNYESLIRTELLAGTTYYILADPIDTNAISQTFNLTCPISFDPCNIIPLTCGDYVYNNFPDGNGAFAFGCSNIFPQGSELIFSFTPEETGQYFFDGSTGPMLHAYVKEASGGCNGNGWICLGNDMYNNLSFQTPMDLQAGVQYYFMFQALYDWDGFGYLSIRLSCQADCIIYADADGDGFGDPALSFIFCGGPYPGYSSNNNDCNDGNANINPAATEICGNQADDDCDGQVDEGCGCGMTVSAGNDESTFFGYSADQTITRNAIVSGGTAPYSYSWTMDRPLSCNQVNSAGDEIFMFGTCANTVCPSLGQLLLNPVCTGSASVKVKLMDTTEVCVTVTDANGCTATDCFVVNATDARCFAGNSNITKVKMCHYTGNPNNPWVQICVDESAVANLEAQGDYVGNCIALREMYEKPEWHLFPNPADKTITFLFSSENASAYNVHIADITGRDIYFTKGEGTIGSNSLEIPVHYLKPGMYFVSLDVNGVRITYKLQIAR